MESLKLLIDRPEAFDELVHESLPQASGVTIATKPGALASGKSGLVISFDVELPSGELHRVQATTTVALFAMMADTMRGIAEREDPAQWSLT